LHGLNASRIVAFCTSLCESLSPLGISTRIRPARKKSLGPLDPPSFRAPTGSNPPDNLKEHGRPNPAMEPRPPMNFDLAGTIATRSIPHESESSKHSFLVHTKHGPSQLIIGWKGSVPQLARFNTVPVWGFFFCCVPPPGGKSSQRSRPPDYFLTVPKDEDSSSLHQFSNFGEQARLAFNTPSAQVLCYKTR